MHIVSNGGLNYTYDRVIYNLDTSKTYYIEAELTNENNIGTSKVQKVNLNAESKVGEFKDKTLTLQNNEIVFKGNEYVGAINTDLKTMKIEINEVGREYITGEILIAEWIDGVACEPTKLPKMTLKSTDGSYSAEMHIVSNGGLSYTYDRVIYNLDINKTYYIEAELTNKDNIGANKVQIANLNAEEEVGIFKDTAKMVLRDNKMIFEEIKAITLELEPKVEETQKEENKVEKEEEKIDKQEEIKNENQDKEEVPEVVEKDKQEEDKKEEENKIDENVTEETNIVKNEINTVNAE